MNNALVTRNDHSERVRARSTSIRFAAAVAALGVFTITSATAAPFFGTRRNDNLTPPSLTGRCAPLPTVNIGLDFSSYYEGTSNFGDFSIRQSQCADPVGPRDGRWEFIFDVGSLLGTHFGTSAPSGTPGVSTITSLFTITGGTGLLRHASGMFDSVVVRDVRSGRPMIEGTFEGVLNVPEPALAGLFGLSMVGLAFVRRSRRASIRAGSKGGRPDGRRSG